MTPKSSARTWSICIRVSLTAPLFVCASPSGAQQAYDPAPYYSDHDGDMSHVGASFTAYRAGIGHTDASTQSRRRPLDGSLRPAPQAALAAPAPVVDWSGTYFGASIGGLMSSTDLDGALNTNIDSDSYVVSGHAGTNYQVGSVVFGGELDASTTNIDDTTHSVGGVTTKTGMDWLASARLRAGVAVDNFLVYGTGGVAFTTSDVEINALGFRADSKELHTGYVIGGGAEMAIVDGINARVEALHYGFSGDTLPTPTGSSDLDLDVTTVRAGVSLKFK